MQERIKFWAIAVAIGVAFALLGKACSNEKKVTQAITVNVPQAMQEAFEQTLKDVKLHKKYSIEFTNSKDANFTVTNQKSSSNELIAYSPVVAVFNEDEELYQSYIEKEIFVPSDTEPGAYDFDFKKIMADIIENPNSMYKVYYPDESMCDWSVFYAFLLYTANDGCYPSDGTNMTETKQVVDEFLQSKKTESFSREAVDKVGGFAKNSVYFMPLADLGYTCKNNSIECRVMYPKTVVYSNYYASFDEIGKILYDALDEDTFSRYHVGYYYLWNNGKYFVKQFKNEVYISNNLQEIELRKNFNAVDVQENTYFSK